MTVSNSAQLNESRSTALYYFAFCLLFALLCLFANEHCFSAAFLPPVSNRISATQFFEDLHESTDKFLSSKYSSLFFSNYDCNLYQHALGHPTKSIYPTYTLYTQCALYNLCMRRDGKWIMFLDEAKGPFPAWLESVDEKVWLYIQPNTRGHRGDMVIKINGAGAVSLTLGEVPSNSQKQFRLSPTFRYYEDPTYLTYRYMAGHLGHVLMEAMTEALIILDNFEEMGNPNVNIVFLEDIEDKELNDSELATEGYNEQLATQLSIDFFGLMTNKPRLQKCSTPTGWVISSAPCKDVPIQDHSHGEDLQVCFRKALAGIARPYFEDVIGAELINEPLRKLIANVTGIPLKRDLFTKEEIVIAVHHHPHGAIHGKSIYNTEEIINYLRQYLPEENFISLIKKRVQVVKLVLDGMSALDQASFFSNVDIYIADQGSAAYLSLFLPRGAATIQAPTCTFNHTVSPIVHECDDDSTQFISIFPHIRVYPFLSFVPDRQVRCVERAVELFPTNCDPILPLEITYRAVVGILRERYKSLIYSQPR